LENRKYRYGTEAVPFSAAVPSDSLLFVSGQGGIAPDDPDAEPGSIEKQTIQTIENIRSILSQWNLTLADVLKVNVYLTDRSHYERFNRVYTELFPKPLPARTVVYCELNFGLLVEIDVIAKLRK